MIVEASPGGELFEALAEAAGRMSALPKDQENTQQRFTYRSIDAIVSNAKPILADLGITIIPTGAVASYEEVTSGSGTRGWRCTCTATYLVGHKSGQSVVAGMIGEAIDYGDKSTTKAAQMAYKYLLTELLGIGSDDPDGESPQTGAETPPDHHNRAWHAVRDTLGPEEGTTYFKAGLESYGLIKREDRLSEKQADELIAALP